MIDPAKTLSVSRQANVLGISRGSVYCRQRPVSDADLKLMHRIDRLHVEFPFAGSRMLQGLLIQEGCRVGRLHVATLPFVTLLRNALPTARKGIAKQCPERGQRMERMGIEALYRKPNTSKPAPGHKIYPYLLRKLAVTRPNQVWAIDITYIPLSADCFAIACPQPGRGSHGDIPRGGQWMARGFIYLAAVLDWFTRPRSWRGEHRSR